MVLLPEPLVNPASPNLSVAGQLDFLSDPCKIEILPPSPLIRLGKVIPDVLFILMASVLVRFFFWKPIFFSTVNLLFLISGIM
jgi:hypothetical protein